MMNQNIHPIIGFENYALLSCFENGPGALGPINAADLATVGEKALSNLREGPEEGTWGVEGGKGLSQSTAQSQQGRN